jgi:hypothetical protein
MMKSKKKINKKKKKQLKLTYKTYDLSHEIEMTL